MFLLNGFAFLLIGLAVSQIARATSGASLMVLGRDAALLCVVLIMVRIVWVALWTMIERLWLGWARQRPSRRKRGSALSTGEAAVVSWAGMRGVVSLAAALAIPLTLADGQPFPFRNEILALTFAAIVATLLGQGLTLPRLIRSFQLDGAASQARLAVQHARREAADAALAMLRHERSQSVDCRHVDVLTDIYRRRRDELGQPGLHSALEPGAGDPTTPTAVATEANKVTSLHLKALEVERTRVIALRDQGTVDDETLHHVLRDLDLEHARLAPTMQSRGIA